MIEPKFQVGDLVAVCSDFGRYVIPKASVIARSMAMSLFDPFRGTEKNNISGFVYMVDPSVAKDFWFQEKWLRPIDPDKEYQDDEERELIHE